MHCHANCDQWQSKPISTQISFLQADKSTNRARDYFFGPGRKFGAKFPESDTNISRPYHNWEIFLSMY
jgi:hypothetical protein